MDSKSICLCMAVFLLYAQSVEALNESLVLKGRFDVGMSKREIQTWHFWCRALYGRQHSDVCSLKFYTITKKRSILLNYNFWIKKHEVTQGEFRRLKGFNPSYLSNCGSRCPVENVRWHDAAHYANLYSKRQGLPTCFSCTRKNRRWFCRAKHRSDYVQCSGWRLPTEAEWVHAFQLDTQHIVEKVYAQKAMQGVVRALHPYSWNRHNSAAKSYLGMSGSYWFCQGKSVCRKKKGRSGIQHVGSKMPGRLGLYDMLGNVRELCFDRFSERNSKESLNPLGPRFGKFRVVRGISAHDGDVLSAFFRKSGVTPNGYSPRYGFRLVRTHFPGKAKRPTSRPTSRPALRPTKRRPASCPVKRR